MTPALTPLVGLFLDGATLTEQGEMGPTPPRTALVGKPVWSPAALLRNLELRVGLPSPASSQAIRVQRFSRRMGEVVAGSPCAFYARSYAVDPLGTATTILAWRDALVLGGWNGGPIAHGGDRLDTVHAIEAGLRMPQGTADRLRSVEEELLATSARPFDELLLAEARTLWQGRWQRVFARLEALGAPVRVVDAAFQGTGGDSDLARLQAALRGEAAARLRPLRGDGSIVVLRAETSWELADATAALLRANAEVTADATGGATDDMRVAILRGGESRALDAALVTQGLASQGLDSVSAWRPALQILPLAVELAYEPRDPYRVLELLTLAVGPFQGIAGQELSAALGESPGIGGPAWRAAKERVAQRTRALALDDARKKSHGDAAAAREADEKCAARAQRIHEWLEAPGHAPNEKSPRAALLALADRVRTWLQRRLAVARIAADDDESDASLATRAAILGAAFSHAQAFHDAVSHDARDGLDLVEARLLVRQVASGGHRMTLATEAEGRIDPVDSPSGLRVPRDLVVWWHCVGGTEWRPPARPWRCAELTAMHDAGISLPDPAARLHAEAKSWHQVILAARRRLVLAIPRWSLAEPMEPHPIVHEIVARFGADAAALERVTIQAHDLVRGRRVGIGGAKPPAIVDLGPLALPAARTEWRLDPALVGAGLCARSAHSASSIEALLGCPLKFVLTYAGALRARSGASVLSGFRLHGTLGHRLVEELHRCGAFARPATLDEAIATQFDTLLREEGAVLLRPGMTFELRQLRDQIARSVRRLAGLLAESRLTIAGVEVTVDEPWRAGSLGGRIDLLLLDERGGDVIVDLKWGRAGYADALKRGTATQLAVYAAARQLASRTTELPAAAYFSLSRGELLATDARPFAGAGIPAMKGPPLSDTWNRIQRTVEKVEEVLATGRVLVTGVGAALPLVEAMGVPEADRAGHLRLEPGAACRYCDYDPLCGRRWESKVEAS
jgi:ATP-dependent helicase/nuclease subunit B